MEDSRASTPVADRYWLLTWTTYGSWMPGDERGFVSRHPDETGGWVLNNIPGVPPDADLPEWQEASRSRMIGAPVFLDRSHAESILAQFQETAVFRGWLLLAAAVMRNHVHLVIGVPGSYAMPSLTPAVRSIAAGKSPKVGRGGPNRGRVGSSPERRPYSRPSVM